MQHLPLTSITVIQICLTLMLALFSHVAQAQGTDLNKPDLLAPEIREIRDRGTLQVAMVSVGRPPFFSALGEDQVGYDIDLAKDFANFLGVERVEFIRTTDSFDQVIAQVAAGQADMAVSKLSRTLARAQYVRFSNPYLSLRRSLVFNRLELAETLGDQDLEDFIRTYNRPLSVLANSSYISFARENFPNARLVPANSLDVAIDEVVNRRVLAAYSDEFEIRRRLAADPQLSLTLRPIAFDDLNDTLGAAFAADSTTLLAMFNLFLEQNHRPLTVEDLLTALNATP